MDKSPAGEFTNQRYEVSFAMRPSIHKRGFRKMKASAATRKLENSRYIVFAICLAIS